MRRWPKILKSGALRRIFKNHAQALMVNYFFQDVYDGSRRPDYRHWSGQWIFACFMNEGLIILPKHDLVTNVGADSDGTNVTSRSMFIGLPIYPLSFPLSHPDRIKINEGADQYLIDLVPWLIESEKLRIKLLRRLKFFKIFQFGGHLIDKKS